MWKAVSKAKPDGRDGLQCVQKFRDHVWIFLGKFLGFFEGGGLNDDETAGLIGKRSSQQHPPGD